MVYTNFPNGLTSFGVPLPGDFITQGNRYFVAPGTGSDGNTGTSIDAPFATLGRALEAATANQNDIVYLLAQSNTSADTTDYQTTTLDWNKDLVHLIGCGANPMIGQRARIAQDASATTLDNLMTVSADACIIANIGIFQGIASSTATSSIALTVSGERNHFINCQISGIGNSSMDDAGSRSLKVSGGENYFEKCYIGLDTVIRGTATTEVEISAGARNIFDDCIINSYTSLSTFKALTAGSPDRFVMLKNGCLLNAVQGITSAVAPTGAIASGSVNGSVLSFGTMVAGYANVTTADDSKTLHLSYSGSVAGSDILKGMGIARAVDVA